MQCSHFTNVNVYFSVSAMECPGPNIWFHFNVLDFAEFLYFSIIVFFSINIYNLQEAVPYEDTMNIDETILVVESQQCPT